MEISIIPNWIIIIFSKDSVKQIHYNILLSNCLIVLSFIVFKDSLINFLNTIPHICLFDYIFKIECPVCGTTRAFCELSKGNLHNAYKLNAPSLFIALIFVFQIPLRIISILKNISIKIINNISRVINYFILIVVFLYWIFNLLSTN